MGSRYETAGVVAVLTIGQTAAVLQLPALAILAGMNRHGRVALASGIGSMAAVVAVSIVVGVMKKGLLPAAVAMTAPLLAVNIVYCPFYTCRAIDLSVMQFFKRTLLSPFLSTLPLAVCLAAARWFLRDHEKISLVVGCALGSAILLPIYWFSVVPPSLKNWLTDRIWGLRRRPATRLEEPKVEQIF